MEILAAESEVPFMNLSARRTGIATSLTALILTAFLAMPFLTLMRHERPWSTLMLLTVAAACGWRLTVTLRARDSVPEARLLATREVTALVAAVLACTATGTGFSWARGAAVVATEFVFLIDVLRLRALRLSMGSEERSP